MGMWGSMDVSMYGCMYLSIYLCESGRVCEYVCMHLCEYVCEIGMSQWVTMKTSGSDMGIECKSNRMNRGKKNKYRASVAEWSKALVSGTGLFGGVGSNPTTCILIKDRVGKYISGRQRGRVV